jgi:hypothetical protein
MKGKNKHKYGPAGYDSMETRLSVGLAPKQDPGPAELVGMKR